MTGSRRVKRFRIDFTQEARDDLSEIAAYVAQDSSVNAARFTAKIRKSIQPLADFPNRSPKAPEGYRAGLQVRQRLLGDYRILFVVHGATVSIVGIRHGRRLPIIAPQ
ncbi:MAG: type II toxin-antitoxin system RelE/ParE family toxin [Phycisphaerales bacterium]